MLQEHIHREDEPCTQYRDVHFLFVNGPLRLSDSIIIVRTQLFTNNADGYRMLLDICVVQEIKLKFCISLKYVST